MKPDMNQTWTRHEPDMSHQNWKRFCKYLNRSQEYLTVSYLTVSYPYISVSHTKWTMTTYDDHGLDIWDLITLKLCESCAPVAHFVSHFARQHETLMQSAGRGSFLAKLLVMIVLRIVCYHCSSCSSCRKSVSNEQISFPLTRYTFASNCTEWSNDPGVDLWGWWPHRYLRTAARLFLSQAPWLTVLHRSRLNQFSASEPFDTFSWPLKLNLQKVVALLRDSIEQEIKGRQGRHCSFWSFRDYAKVGEGFRP